MRVLARHVRARGVHGRRTRGTPRVSVFVVGCISKARARWFGFRDDVNHLARRHRCVFIKHRPDDDEDDTELHERVISGS